MREGFALFLAETALPWFNGAEGILLWLGLLFLPVCIFKRARGFAGVFYVIIGTLISLFLWAWSSGFTYLVWGIPGLLIGNFFAGVGVVLTAIVITIVEPNMTWQLTRTILTSIVLGLGYLSWGHFLISRYEKSSKPTGSKERGTTKQA